MQNNSFIEKNHSHNFVAVYIAPLPTNAKLGEVFPRARFNEIQAVKNEKVQREKYFVWKLLEYAVANHFDKPLNQIQFIKESTGKWSSDLCEFSLSHSENALCVALSNAPVGVDIQKIRQTKIDLSKEILDTSEYAHYQTLAPEEQTVFLINAWTKKESLFKQKNTKILSREEFRNQTGPIFQTTVCLQDETYALSVATNLPDKTTLSIVNL